MKSYQKLLFTTVMVLLLAACQPTATKTPVTSGIEELTPAQIITIGVVSDDPAGAISDFQQIADYLAKNLANEGIKAGKVIVVPDMQTLSDKLVSGEVDLYFESPYGALTVYEAGALPLARRWKGGISEYNSLIVVRKDSGISSLEQLQGKMIAFEDSGSTSGYLLPKAYLVGEGMVINEKAEPSSPINEDEIGYYFTGDMDNSFAQVVAGKIAAAAIQSDAYDEYSQEEKDQLTVLAQTPTVPRHIAMASPMLAETLRKKIAMILIDMENNDEGKAVLAATEKTTRFDELPGGAEQTMKYLQELFAPVR